MSNFFQNLPEDLTKLTYEQLEVSCHAIESYCQRLQQQQYEFLKIHCFRAVLETLIVKHRPDRKRSGLRSVKHFNEMSFAMLVCVIINFWAWSFDAGAASDEVILQYDVAAYLDLFSITGMLQELLIEQMSSYHYQN